MYVFDQSLPTCGIEMKIMVVNVGQKPSSRFNMLLCYLRLINLTS